MGSEDDFQRWDLWLRDSSDEGRLDHQEREQLREIGMRLDDPGRNFMRNRAFAISEQLILQQPTHAPAILRWLSQVVRTLDGTRPPAVQSQAYFSPGEDCLRALTELCAAVRSSLDICVFTLADDRLSEVVLDCHARGVAVRLITDDEKRHDAGSDIKRLRRAGIAVRTDSSPYHMHHKFALFDRRRLANGSFNWTRSASVNNEENLVVCDDPQLVGRFSEQFDQLWQRFR